MTLDINSSQPDCEWFCKKPSLLRVAATWTVARAAAGLQNVRGNRCDNGFAILMYHRVAEHIAGVEAPTLNVTPRQLREQLTGLLSRGFKALPLSSLVEAQREARPIPPNAFAVTFDDGYENNYVHAWPVLRELRVPATIFVATKYLDTDQPFPFDDWPAAGSSRVAPSTWRPMTIGQCEELLEDGLIELGAHTHSHMRFLGRSEAFRRDMTTCLDVMRERFAIEQPTFAFPYGDLDEELIEVTEQLGVSCSLSTRCQRVLPGDDPHRWGRYSAETNDSAAVLAAKLSGWYTALAGAGKTLLGPWMKAAAADRHPTRRELESSFREASLSRKAVSQS